MRIVVLGYIVRGPLGGLAWHHGQYLRGLQDLGHDVHFLEDSGTISECCYDPLSGVNSKDPAYGLSFAARFFELMGLNSWAYFDRHTGAWHGPSAGRITEICRSAEIALNISLANPLEHGLERAPVRIAIDTDPVFTQIRNLADADRHRLTASHNRFFSYGANLPCKSAPDDGFPWRATRQPVVLRLWPEAPPCEHGPFTTVMQWDSYASREWKGRKYGQKSDSFGPFWSFPSQVSARFEIVMGAGRNAPIANLEAHGWRVISPNQVALTPESFRQYVHSSKAEFSIAKHGYVQARCGWFSDRTSAYLASGRPAVVEDTGFQDWLGAPGGVLAFQTRDQAAAQIEKVNREYSLQCRLARNVIAEYFEAGKVLRHLLAEAL
jgi:hypothetical protein